MTAIELAAAIRDMERAEGAYRRALADPSFTQGEVGRLYNALHAAQQIILDAKSTDH